MSERPEITPPQMPSIAVLPFTNMSDDTEQDYFADGIVEDITTALARLNVFFVIARNSSFVYKNRAVDIKQVGRELGVQYVLEGSVRKSGNRLRITGQLIEAASARHVWADRFDGALDDVFDLQDQITNKIVWPCTRTCGALRWRAPAAYRHPTHRLMTCACKRYPSFTRERASWRWTRRWCWRNEPCTSIRVLPEPRHWLLRCV